MELIEGINIGSLPDPFLELSNERKILKIKGDDFYSSLNEDYLKLLKEIIKKDDEFKEIKEGDIVKGKISSLSEKEITIDIGYKDLVYIDNKLSDNKIIDSLRLGEEINVMISKINDNPFYIKGSITDIIKLNVGEKLKDHFNLDKPFMALVKEIMPAGFFLDIEMDNITLDAFMPTTLAGVNKLTDEQKEDLIGQRIEVMLETLQQDKGMYVVSRRKYLQGLIDNEIKKLKKEFEKNPKKLYQGLVTGTTPYGIFVEFNGCLTGMIHKDNVNYDWIKVKNFDSIQPGTEISFYIREIISKLRKIILTQVVRESVSLWDTIRKDKILKGVIFEIRPFGVIIKLDQETKGLIQNFNSQKSSIGDEVTVKVKRIMKEDRKIYLELVEKQKKES